jgi:hypothetical protein
MSGLSRTPGKRVGVHSPPRVRIPLSPPIKKPTCLASGLFYWRRGWRFETASGSVKRVRGTRLDATQWRSRSDWVCALPCANPTNPLSPSINRASDQTKHSRQKVDTPNQYQTNCHYILLAISTIIQIVYSSTPSNQGHSQLLDHRLRIRPDAAPPYERLYGLFH